MPLIDFSNHDPDFTKEQIEQCERIVEGVRNLNNKVVRLGGSLASLTAAADRVEALLASLDEVAETRAMETYRHQFDFDRPNNVIPFNPATGEFNPLSPRMNVVLEGKKLVAECVFANCYESAPDMVQGGMVAAVYDQFLAYAVMVEGLTGPTLSLQVSYLKRTPINEALRFECEVESNVGKTSTWWRKPG